MNKLKEQKRILLKEKLPNSEKEAKKIAEERNVSNKFEVFYSSSPISSNIQNFILDEKKLKKVINISNKNINYISKTLISSNKIKDINLSNNIILEQLSKLQKSEIYYMEKFNFNFNFYSDIVKLYNRYDRQFNAYFLSRIISKFIFKNYIDLQFRLISKIEILNNNKISNLQKFYNFVANDIASFQFKTVESFKRIGIIEERTFDNDNVFIEANLYGKISQGLSPVYKVDFVESAEDVYKKTLVSDIYDAAKEIVKNIIEIDKKSQLSGKCIIKPTVDVMSICFNLPTLIADDEQKFSNIIDCFYKTVWENRTKMEEYIDINDLNFINDLRRYYFHDLEHGKEREYRPKYLAVSNFFKLAINKKYPSNSKEWQISQLYLYNTILGILSNLDLKISE